MYVVVCRFSIGHSKRRTPTLTLVAVQSTNIPPKEVVLYTKQTQTNTSGHERDGKFFFNVFVPLHLILKETYIFFFVILKWKP